MKDDGVPLPAALSGTVIERLIRIDEALIYLVNGALSYLADREKFEETGALTVDDAKLALSEMLTIYFSEAPTMIPVGGMMEFGGATIPAKWILCDGAAISRTTYADLFAAIGTAYGVGNGTTTFNLPNLRDKSPFGAGGASVPALGNTAGAAAVALAINNLPSHDHDYADPGHRHTQRIGTAAGANALAVGTTNNGNFTVTRDNLDNNVTGITFHAQGGNIPHNNLHPVLGVNYIIYAGK